MPQFHYSGVDRQGKKAEGQVEAASEGELRMLLRGQGVRPTRISRSGVLGSDIGTALRAGMGGGRVSMQELSVFTRQIHVLISSGVPLVQALEILCDQTSDRALRRILPVVKEKVSSGSFLWEALSQYPKSFPKIYISLIRAAESSGAMEGILDRLARYLESSSRIMKMVRGAMLYPGMISLVGLGVVWAMLTFVIPKFKDLLVSNGQELPGPTKVVIAISEFLNTYFVHVFGILVTLGFLIYRYFGSEEGRAFRDQVVIRLPIFGDIVRKAGVARFCRTMGTLLAAGVPLIEAIEICRDTIDQSVLEAALSNLRKEVEAGKSIGAVLSRIAVFPKMAVQMISIGEATGNMEKMLEKVADLFEADVENLAANIGKLIEPFVLVFLGGAIAAIMISMYLPIFKLAGSSGGGP